MRTTTAVKINPYKWKTLAAILTAANLFSLSGCSIQEFAATMGLSASSSSETSSVSEAPSSQETASGSKEQAGMAPRDSEAGLSPLSAAYEQNGGSETKENLTAEGTVMDQSGVHVFNRGDLTLEAPAILAKGQTSSEEDSKKNGRNAAALVNFGGRLSVRKGTITGEGMGAAGVFANGQNSQADLNGTVIHTAADYAPGVMAMNRARVNAVQNTLSTVGADSPAAAAGSAGSSLSLVSVKADASGLDSAGIYTAGEANAVGSQISSSHWAAALDGKSTLLLTDCDLTSTGEYGVMSYYSNNGLAAGGKSNLSMTAGSLTGGSEALFYVTSTRSEISLQGVKMPEDTITLLKASKDDYWGGGKTGGEAALTVTGQTLAGDIVCDKYSKVDFQVTAGSHYTGAINPSDTGPVNFYLDGTSTWKVSSDCYISVFTAGIPQLTNVKDDGHTIYYDSTQPKNKWLAGKTIALKEGGSLTPNPRLIPNTAGDSSSSEDALSSGPAVTVTMPEVQSVPGTTTAPGTLPGGDSSPSDSEDASSKLNQKIF